MKKMIHDVRPSPIAGSWYPENPSRLAQSIDGFLANSREIKLSGSPVGIIVPHAGHLYSGQTAAKAFKAIENFTPELVIIFSPHHAYTPHACSTTAYGYYQTPLGKVSVNHELVEKISEGLASDGHDPIFISQSEKEHAIEIQLPFLQKIFSHEFSLIPLMLRDLSGDLTKDLVKTIVEVIDGRKTLVISSTDLSHFHPLEIANKLDGYLVKALVDFSVEELIKAVNDKGSEACGISGMILTLLLTKMLGAKRCQITGYTTSAEVTGETSSVVGYVSAVITT